MTIQTVIDGWALAMDQIHDRLRVITTPKPQSVHRSEPLSIPGDCAVAFWYEGNRDLIQTLSGASVSERLTIRWYWRHQDPQQIRERLEDELFAAGHATRAALWDGTKLASGFVQKAEPGEITAGYSLIGDIRYRVLTIPVTLWLYDTEDIAP